VVAVHAEPDLFDPPPVDAPPDVWAAFFDGLPQSRAFGIRFAEMDAGRLVATFDPRSFPPNPNGAVHGGLVVAAADHVMGMCATATARERLPATATLLSSFLRPSFAPLRYEARVIQAGRNVLFLEATVDDRDGRRCATFNGTWMAGAARPRTA